MCKPTKKVRQPESKTVFSVTIILTVLYYVVQPFVCQSYLFYYQTTHFRWILVCMINFWSKSGSPPQGHSKQQKFTVFVKCNRHLDNCFKKMINVSIKSDTSVTSTSIYVITVSSVKSLISIVYSSKISFDSLKEVCVQIQLILTTCLGMML